MGLTGRGFKEVIRKMKLNKKGYINDVLTGSAVLLGFFLVLGFSIFLIIQWNDAVQSSSAFNSQSKQIQQQFTDTYPSIMGWLFPITLIGLFLYTIITAYLVDVISRIWFIIGFIITIIQAVVGYVISQIYGQIAQTSIFGVSTSYIPGAEFYFSNIILINSIWAFLILLVLYFKREV